VSLNDEKANYTFFQNKIKNQKYNILTFLPVVITNQFSYFSNQFYLLMVISQFFDSLKVGFLFSYVAPLVFVLCVTLFKEAIDDIFRFKQDKIINLQEFTLVESDKKNGIIKRKIISQDIKIGQLLEINQNERIPADMIVLKTFEESGTVYIRTDQLDGETDWKLRKAPGLTQTLDLEALFDLKGYLEFDPPSKMIYEFKGVLNVYDEKIYAGAVNLNDNKSDIVNSNSNTKSNSPDKPRKSSNIDNFNLNNSGSIKEPLSLENTMWASTILASKKALGLVIFTGREMRFQMNSSNPKTKKGALDLELNYLSKILFFIMLISALIITFLKGFRTNLLSMLLDFFRFVVLLCAIIPISLAVNLDISKAVNSTRINKDKKIPETIARNSTIPEELGRIEYIFSDKTGTLTKNEMEFKRLAMENDLFGLDSFNDLKLITEDECKRFDAPAMDIVNLHRNASNTGNINNLNSVNINSLQDDLISSNESNSSFHCRDNSNTLKSRNALTINNKRIRRNRNKVIRDTIAAMALCNNVTPIYEEKKEDEFIEKFNNIRIVQDSDTNRNNNINKKDLNNNNIIDIDNPVSQLQKEYEVELDFEKNMKDKQIEIEGEVEKQENEFLKYKNIEKINYQASSPDEVALVKIAEELNMTLVFRNDKQIKIRNANDIIEEYDVLANFPFSSDTKRMGILLRNIKHRHIIFYLKGAESIMEKFVKNEYKGYIRENAENLACIGLRTLVFTQKIVSEEFYQRWQIEYNEARTSLDNRNEKILEVMGKLENNMDFLAVTGVEDLLQDDVCNTIESLRNAGIKIWMLTGDKVETATCISISAGLKSKSDKLFYIKDKAKEKDYVFNQLKKIDMNINQTVLIIDGDCLEVALNHHEREFFETAMKVEILSIF